MNALQYRPAAVLFLLLVSSLCLAQPTVTTPFSYTGSVQTFTVPPCVVLIHVKAWGGGGSGGGTDSYNGAGGGGGAYVQSDLTVVPGQVLTIIIGGGGGAGQGCVTGSGGGPGGWGNGLVDGAAGGNAGGSGCSGGGGGGGGAAAVFNGGTALLVAAGGGGGSGGGQYSSGALGGGGGADGNSVAGSCTSPGLTGASANGNGTPGGTRGGSDGGGGGGGGGGMNGGTGGAVAASCDCGACGGAGGASISTGAATVINNGSGATPGNSGDPALPAGDATGGAGSTSGGNGYMAFTYNAPGSPTAAITAFTNPSCFGGTNGTITGAGNGGGGTYTYSWSPGTQTTPTATALGAGTYTITVFDQAGCHGSATQTLTDPPQLTSVASATAAKCFGACTGSMNAAPTGGTAPYTYSWSGSACTTATCSNVCAGTYTSTVTDKNGCVITGTSTVTQPTALVLQMTSKPAHCGKPDGMDSVTVTGGTGPYQYSWTPGTSSATPGYHNITPGQYTVFVRDANLCVNADTSAVFNIVGLKASIASTTPVSCFGGSNGTATATQTGATGTVSYAWSPSGGSAATASNLAAGNYTCLITDSVGCFDKAIATITQPPLLIVKPLPPATICISQSVTLTATGQGGTPGYTYTWSLNGTPLASNTQSPVVTTTYTVSASDTNGCVSSSQTVTITVRAPLKVVAIGTDSVCPGVSVQLGSAANGGDGNYSYFWNPAASLNNASIPNPIASPASTTTYSVVLKDKCGTPADTSTVTVTIFPTPVPQFTAPDTAGCAPFCVTFHSSSNPKCATATWVFGDGSLGTGCDSVKHCYKTAGPYSPEIRVKDIHGCKGNLVKSNYITVYPLPVAAFTATPQPTDILTPQIFFSDSISTLAVSQYWNFGDTLGSTDSTRQTNHTYRDTGCYTITLGVKSAKGCVDTLRRPICIDPLFTFYAPDAFTPNADGKNDTWTPIGVGIDANNYELTIYDRWGIVVFHTLVWGQSWDGKVNGGAIAQIDTYVWDVVVKDFREKRYKLRGVIHLIR
jgi:gliding motility-associated-like protein